MVYFFGTLTLNCIMPLCTVLLIAILVLGQFVDLFVSLAAPQAPVIDTQRSLAYDQLFLCWRLPPESAPAWHFSVEYRRRGVVPGGGARGGMRGGLAAARWGWQRLDEVNGSSAVIDRLEMDSVYVLRVRGCNKAGYGEYSEEVYLHTPPAPGKTKGRMCASDWCSTTLHCSL